MAHELIVPGLPGNVLAVPGVATLFLRPGTVTGIKLPLFNAPVPLSAEAAAAHRAVGYEGPALQEKADQLRPRPLYLLRGRQGQTVLLAGPVGETAAIPANTRWFRDLLKRPMTPKVHDLNRANILTNPKLPSWKWDLETRIKYQVHPNPPSTLVYHALQQEMIDLWRQRSGLGGIAVFSAHWDGKDSNVIMPTGPAIAPTYAGFWGRDTETYFTWKAITPEAMCGLDDHAHLPKGRRVADEMAWGALNNQSGGFGGWWETWNKYTSTREYRLKWGMDSRENMPAGYPFNPYVYARVSPTAGPGQFQQDHDYLVSQAAPFGEVGLDVSSVRIGSILPFPLASTRVGYVYGLPHEPAAITWTGVVTADGASQTLDFAVDSSTTYVTGAQYKRLFPLETLPADKAASLQTKWAELPDDMLFAVIHFPKGLGYRSVGYDETVLARDLRRAGETLDALVFDHVDETQPPITYKSLGARSVEAINKKKNGVIVLPLLPDGEGTTDLSEVVFATQGDSFIVATRGGNPIDEGEALVAIKAGAPFTFASPLTADRVALELYAMPTWDELMTMEGDSESTDYVVDEARLTYEGTFDFMTDDELARALPTLLGFDRSQFGAVVAAVAYGVPRPSLRDA